MATNAKKKRIDAMMPVKQWLSLSEALSYLDISQPVFMNAASGLPVATIGAKKYYRVKDLNKLLEQNLITK